MEKRPKYKKLPQYFAIALRGVLEESPRGTKSRVARLAGVSSAMITDIIKERKFGSEEVRWAIVDALGWEYEEFLKYGQRLEEGENYNTSELLCLASSFDDEYLRIQFADKVRLTINGRETAYTPVVADDRPPLLLPPYILDSTRVWGDLAAFRVKARNMEPGLPYGGIVVVDFSLRDLTDDRIYLLADGDDYQINRIREKGGNLYSVSENPTFSPELLEVSRTGLVIGQVILSLHSHI